MLSGSQLLLYDEALMASYLITVAGFIRSTLARAVLAQDWEVVGFANFLPGSTKMWPVCWIGSSFIRRTCGMSTHFTRIAAEWIMFFTKRPYLSVPRSVKHPLGDKQANVDGTLPLLVAARDAKVKRVVYTAPSSAYGDTPHSS
jgi:nucleoside-diphosphate-sugar epimerase